MSHHSNFHMTWCKNPIQIPAINTEYVDQPIRMTLPGINGQQITLQYDEGEWQLMSVEQSKEIRRLQKENEKLQADNGELDKQLKKALRLAATLQLDLQKLTERSQGIKFSSEIQKKEFLETDPEELVHRRLE